MTQRLILIVVLMTAALGAQSPAPVQDPLPAFEVASIRRNDSGTPFMGANMGPGGRLNMTNIQVRNLIVRAYGVQTFQIIGGPDWISRDRFDIVAKAEGDATPEQINLMLRSLLAERFRFVAHQETRELPVYYLVKSREDGSPGPALKPAAAECGPTGRGRPGGPAARGPAPGPGGARGGCRVMLAPGRMEVAGQPISALVTTLANQVGRPVIDKSGLAGNFDFVLSFMPELGRGAPVGPLPPGAPELPPIDPNAPSLFTALQEQLGLKLESERAPVEVLVIDSIQPPTED